MMNKPQRLQTKRRVPFLLNNCQQLKVKQLTIHPTKEWIGIVNNFNTFSLWNYQENILIKSFSCNNLDDNKNIDVRDLIFYDRYSICSGENKKHMRSNIIFVTATKIFFFDYAKEIVKQINQKEFEQKNIKKVCVYSETKICIAMSDGSFKVLDSKDLYSKNSMPVRTIKGYHTKSINWIFSYSQNYNELPRIITASSQDSLMACWNVDMILNSPHQVQQATPCFKFLMGSKNKGKDSNNGQQILSLQYDPSSYHLITLTQSYIALWSTMTGMQLKRFKNQINFREIIFFNHFSYGTDCFLAHGNSGKVFVVRYSGTQIQIDDNIDLRALPEVTQNQQQVIIEHIKCLPHQPSTLFVTTQNSLVFLQLDKYYIPAFGVHPGFLTKLSTINSRQFIKKSQGQIRSDITSKQIKKIKFEDQILINTFYLSADANWLYFNLVEIQYSTMLHELKKYKFTPISELSPFKQVQGNRFQVFVNSEGKQIIVFNKTISYYQLYQAQETLESHESLLDRNDPNINQIDFYKKMKLIGSGYCKDIVWHQYKNQFAAIVAFDEKEKLIDYVVSREKKGFFKKQVQAKLQLSGNPKSICCAIFQKVGVQEYKIIQKTEPYISGNYKVFNMGNFFGYSHTNKDKQKKEILNYICSDRNAAREIQGEIFIPERLYVSYCQNFYIVGYDGYYIIYRIQQNGGITYLRTVEHTLLHGYFWEKLFFYVTPSELYFLQILNSDIVLIKLADSVNSNFVDTVVTSTQDDDLQPWCGLLPSGQLQISSIINMNVLLLNESGNISLIPLDKFPYVKFCVQVSSGIISEGYGLYEKASVPIQKCMKETLTNYSMVLPDLMV